MSDFHPPGSNETLRNDADHYRALFDMSPFAVYSIDASGAIQKFNRVAAELWGREPALGDTDERFCGSFKLFRPDGTFMPHDQCPMAQVVSGEILEARNAEVIIERPDGSRITVIVNIRPLKDANGDITGAINCFYDITERARIERERQQQADALADLSRRKDEFLAMLSHELRNPLAPIVNAMELLRQSNEDPLQERTRTIIERQVAQLTRLVDDLMDVSRVSAGRVHLHLADVTMSSVVERAVETVRPLIDQRGHELTLALSPQPIWLCADAARLEQVVVNLLGNAAKYTENGGHIWLNVEQEGKDCVLRVRDSGIGIAPELLPRVFDLFTQADRSLAHSQGGLGIGLALVQRLVQMHHGRVEAHSELGHGSEFVVTLPVALSLGAQPPPALPEANKSATRSLRVLVADDNVDMVESLAMVMKSLGHDVRKAYDGSVALGEALDYRPDIMLLDIGLPGLDGYQLATRIREQPSLQHVVLVAFTGYGDESARQRSFKVGFDHHLTKPADFKRLQQILASVS
jgi:PAS domain S-box-containing protein